MAVNPMGEVAMQATPTARAVVNTNFGITNIVSLAESKERILNTLKTCVEILSQHCGPQSGYAMLIDNNSAGENFQPSIFTRDGIRILRSVDFVSPLETYIKDMLTYIGTRVDNNAKDGTTTSMLFSAQFLTTYLSDTQEHEERLSNYTYARLAQELNDKVLSNLQQYVFTLNRFAGLKEDEELDDADAMQLAGLIAYCQALSSSGGDLALAKAMRSIFAASPRASWEFISYNHTPKENGPAFSVETPEYDAKFKCNLGMASDGIFNHALGSEYIAEDVRVFIYADALIDGSAKTIAVLNYLSEYPIDKPLVMVGANIDPHIVVDIQKLNAARKAPISLWIYVSEVRLGGVQYPWELMLVNAICGCEPYDTKYATGPMNDSYTFMAKKVHWHDGSLYIYDTVKPLPNSCVHPFYADRSKATEYYNGMRDGLVEQLDLYSNGHKPDGRAQAYYTEMLNKLACVHRPTLRLGGTAHDQLANSDVAQDVEGAIMSSLKHGCVINGPLSLMNAIVDTGDQLFPEGKLPADATAETKFTYNLLNSMLKAVSRVVSSVYVNLHTGNRNFSDEQAILMKNHPETYFNVLSEEVDTWNNFFDSEIDAPGSEFKYPVTHPVAIYEEMLRRSKELLLKFITTNKIIIAGGVVLNQDKDKK